jgi:hypothetical protein
MDEISLVAAGSADEATFQDGPFSVAAYGKAGISRIGRKSRRSCLAHIWIAFVLHRARRPT